MSAMEQHVRQLKQQHAARVNELQTSMDSQSIQIDDLLAQLEAKQAESQRAKRSAGAASQQVSVIEKKLAAAKADLNTATLECAELLARQHESDSKAQTLSAAAKLTADREVNLQQQISALKQKIASSSNQQDILDWQNRVERAHCQIAELQQEKQQADAKVMQFSHLREELITRKHELARESQHKQEALSALSCCQAEQEQLQKQLEAVAHTDRHRQSQLAVLTDKVSQQQHEVAQAKEQTAEANQRFEDSQLAAAALEQQLKGISSHAASQNASRQHVQHQLESSQVQVQEQADTVRKLVEKLDVANASMLAKDQDIKLLNGQVQQMQALVAQTQAAKQDVQQIKVQLDASAELLDTKVQEITTLRGKVVALQRQQAQAAILEAALACSKSEVQKKQAKIDDLEVLLAGKQDDLDSERAKQKQQRSQSASMQTAMETLQRQLDDAFSVQKATQQQLTAAQKELSEYRQEITDLQVLLASSNAIQQSSSQSILALQESASQQTTAFTAAEAKCQTLLAELDSKDEQLKQAIAKLRAAEYAASAAQDAAGKLQNRLTGQQTEAGDQSRELTEALEVGSLTVQQLEQTIQALQDKVFAAENATEAQQQQLSSQQAAAFNAGHQVDQLAQQLASKNSLVTSLQTALVTANFVAESNQQLVSSLQESSNSKQVDASQQVQSLLEQMQLQASKNGDLMVELSSIRGKLLAANQAIAAGQEKLEDALQEQTYLAGRVAFLTKLLERREQREWEAKIQSAEAEVTMHEEAAGTLEHSAEGNELTQHMSVTPAGIAQQPARLRPTPLANGAVLKPSINATADCDAIATQLSNTANTAQQAKRPAVKAEDSMGLGGNTSLGVMPGQTAMALEVKQAYTGLAATDLPVDDKENVSV